MPIYTFENKRTGKQLDIFQRMKDEHIYIDDSEDKWERVWMPLTFSIDSLSEIDPYDSKAFAKKTGEKKGTYGDLMDASKEMSEKRKAQNGGHDDIEQKYFEEFAKKRNGKKHKIVRDRELKASLAEKDIEIEF